MFDFTQQSSLGLSYIHQQSESIITSYLVRPHVSCSDSSPSITRPQIKAKEEILPRAC